VLKIKIFNKSFIYRLNIPNYMDIEEDTPLCTGLEKVLYSGRCEHCNGAGKYKHNGTNHPLFCDYYDDVFLKKLKENNTQTSQNDTQMVPPPKKSDTKATRRLLRFEDSVPKPKK